MHRKIAEKFIGFHPRVRMIFYMVSFVTVISLLSFFIIIPTLSAKGMIISKVDQMGEQETRKAVLSQEEEKNYSIIRNLNTQIDKLESRLEKPISKEYLQELLEKTIDEKDLVVEDIEYVHFWNEDDSWKTVLQIEVSGLYEDVLKVISLIKEIGNNYFVQDAFIMQQGAREAHEESDWFNSTRYLSYVVQEEPGYTGDYSIEGRAEAPVFIETENGEVAPFLRLKNIKYSDNTIIRYNWEVEKATVLIGEKEYDVGYPQVDFSEHELTLNADFLLEPKMIGEKIKSIKMYWRSGNRSYEIVLGLNWPSIIITEEMFLKESPWEGDLNKELSFYNRSMLNSYISTRFNVIFVMEEEPAVYFDHVANEINKLRELARDADNISVDDNGKKLVIEGKEGLFEYLIKDQKLFMNNIYLFSLEKESSFLLENDNLLIQLNVFSTTNELSYNLSL